MSKAVGLPAVLGCVAIVLSLVCRLTVANNERGGRVMGTQRCETLALGDESLKFRLIHYHRLNQRLKKGR